MHRSPRQYFQMTTVLYVFPICHIRATKPIILFTLVWKHTVFKVIVTELITFFFTLSTSFWAKHPGLLRLPSVLHLGRSIIFYTNTKQQLEL